jgi:hypothetical protein
MMEEEVEMVEVAVTEWEEVEVTEVIEAIVMTGTKEVVIEDLVQEEKMIGQNRVAHHNVKREGDREEDSVIVEVIEEVVEVRQNQKEHGVEDLPLVVQGDFLVVMVEKGLKEVVDFQEEIEVEVEVGDLWAEGKLLLQLRDQNICV